VSESPRVTVVIPACNAEATLAETLASATAGQGASAELLVIDDGSTDGTGEVAAAAGVRCVRTANGGVAAARNVGIREAEGEFIAFLDADDLWLPGKLGRQVAALDADGEVGVVTTGFRAIDGGGGALPMSEGVVPRTEAWTGDVFEVLLLEGNFVPTLTVMTRAALLEEVGGFDEELRISEDYDLWLRLARVSRFAHIPEVLAEYRVTEGSLSHASIDRSYEATRTVVRRHGEGSGVDAGALRRRLAAVDLEEGWLLMDAGRHKNAVRPLLRSLRGSPSARTAAYLGAAILGRRAHVAAKALRRKAGPG
jgi:glycosyltransferase involved in cell wall biosynthesis